MTEAEKLLIERLRDNRVTGFNLAVAACEAADRIEELERERNALLEELSRIAQIAHAGGFAVVEIMDALTEIRKATIPYWEIQEA